MTVMSDGRLRCPAATMETRLIPTSLRSPFWNGQNPSGAWPICGSTIGVFLTSPHPNRCNFGEFTRFRRALQRENARPTN